ncbi:MAG: hypothetical protein IJJ22_01620, partial [Oscillospiraceae bacterium]|nr:hypothetical protein [Oscillospiraceae bacterium]
EKVYKEEEMRGNADVVATGGEYSSGIGCGSGGIGGSITIDGNARVQARALESTPTITEVAFTTA